MTNFATILDFIWNDHTHKITHLVPTIDNFDADEEVVTVCGNTTMYADIGAGEYEMCAECTGRTPNVTDDITLHSGAVLTGIHPEGNCGLLGACAIHRPSEHPLKDAPMDWYGEIRHLVRVCEHGYHHPDPDDMAFKVAIGEWMTVEAIASVHLVEENCDGCCHV